MKSIFAFLILSALSKGLAAQKPNCNHYKQELHFKSSELENMRSDTLDILNYHIELDISNIASRAISGSCTIDFQPKMDGVSSISLDLLGFTVDSIIQNGAPLSYSYNDTLLVAELDGIYDLGERSAIRVYYRGTPSIDPSGWGGFYMQSGYAFNLGVGFESYPHNFGRAWFPCFDNFVERSTYSFNIITAAGEIAACNGHLANRYNLPSGKVANEWIMEDKIPTYLACVAVSSYSTVHLSHAGKEKDIPIEIYALSNDTSAVKSSFANLGPAVDAFENAFGPYRWEKIGYSMVPFNSGAMEHATNIAYPRTSGVGGLGSETLMAHELAHSWWGNLATCHKAEEMWINEGMASYCESLFLEHVYGRGEYEEDVASRHLYVLRYPHHLEDGFWALDSVPLKHTYGDHVYRKGADIAHTLRGYLGDELFFSS
ncbi:MAG: M1 family metallopeptidase, partial [Luteibaculum sp.]